MNSGERPSAREQLRNLNSVYLSIVLCPELGTHILSREAAIRLVAIRLVAISENALAPLAHDEWSVPMSELYLLSLKLPHCRNGRPLNDFHEAWPAKRVRKILKF
jgi:hypothetical protein